MGLERWLSSREHTCGEPSWIPSTHTGKFTTSYNPRSRGSRGNIPQHNKKHVRQTPTRRKTESGSIKIGKETELSPVPTPCQYRA